MTAHLLALPQPAGRAGNQTGKGIGEVPSAVTGIANTQEGPHPYRHGLLVLSLALVCQVPIALAVLYAAGVWEF